MSVPQIPDHLPRYGVSHPEFVENAVWAKAAEGSWTGYRLCQHLRQERTNSDFCQDFSHSSYRESLRGPFWSWERFGRTSTALPDGRVIHIAGEHEDSYDPDFCIYNDVVVECPGGPREFYLYPRDVFPPTDFHSATLVGREIILVGSLGYKDMRQPGVTQVFKFDTHTLMFSRLATSGDGPGWISRHRAEKIGETAILIVGGKVKTPAGDYIDNPDLFELDLMTWTWSRRTHGDLAIFPVTREVFQRCKSPVFGTANPQRASNPFWLAMAKHNWPPSRARLHFADVAPAQPQPVIGDLPAFVGPPPEPGTPEFDAFFAKIDFKMPKLARRREDVIWTAVRKEAGNIVLADGRRLRIGGSVKDYGDEYADPWIYNDIVVTDASGEISIYTYPVVRFPLLWSWVTVAWDGGVLIFGFTNQLVDPEGARRFVSLRLDPQTYEISPLTVGEPAGFRLNLYPGCDVREGNRIIFPNNRMTEADPRLGIAIDLEALTWGVPFPYEPPPSFDDD